MITKRLKAFFITTHLCCALSVSAYEEPNLLTLTDRGPISNTPYTLSYKEIILEAGYQYQHLIADGSLQNIAQPFLFYGLPAHSELIVQLPTYYQPTQLSAGIGPTILGVKHQSVEGKNWVTGIEAFVTTPSGSAEWGSPGFGIAINGILRYQLNSVVDMTLMLGTSSLTEPSNLSSARFNSFNPSLVVSLAATEKMTLFAETFAQTKTSPIQNGNYNIDCGLYYLIKPHLLFDAEVGQQLSHEAGIFKQYINGGLTLQF